MEKNKDQHHPQALFDRVIIDTLLAQEANDYNLAELARLLIRYRGFPGARDIQNDLNKIIQKWHLTEEELFEKTRKIHATNTVYNKRQDKSKNEEDWS